MSKLIKHLKSFNRKERYHLLKTALGEDTFTLSSEFRQRLMTEFELDVPLDAFVAMDYHLDWLAMSLYLTKNPNPKWPISNEGLFDANQRDADLLIAFERDSTNHVLILEAKMETGWTTRQIEEKAERLGAIFSNDRTSGVASIYFGLLSPNPSAGLEKNSKWPEWMQGKDGRLRWMKLPRPSGLKQVKRSDKTGRQSKGGNRLQIFPIERR